MTTLGHVFRGIQRLGHVLETSTKVLNSPLRRASTLARNKFVEGENGEKIIPSPHGELSYPECTIHEYIWSTLDKYPNKIAVECGQTGRKYTYAESRDASNYVARSLINMGFKEGDVVALVTPNLPETALAFLGILEAGLVVTTINPLYTSAEISRQLQSSGAKGIITAAEIAPTVLEASRKCLPSDAPFIVVEDGTREIPEGTIPFKDLISRGKSLPPVSFSGHTDSLAVLPYSSGTTGLPKGVMLTHRNIVSNMEMVKQCDNGSIFRDTTESYQEVVPGILPFFHIFGMTGIMLSRLSVGNKLVTLSKFQPDILFNVMEKHKPTILYCVPPVVLFLSIAPMVKKHHLENIHAIFSGAAPLGEADVNRLYNKFGFDNTSLKFCQGYGLTECSPVSFVEIQGVKYASIGKNVTGCEARLVDPITNEDISMPGQTGELLVRGVHVMKGYLNNEAATKETLVGDGWLKTGDIAYFDEDFDFFITDRLKELIKVKGFQVPPAELEALLRTHPDVAEAAVIGIPDVRSGEVPKAFVLLKDGRNPSEEEIKNFVKGQVSEYKQLEGGVTFVNEIPKNPSGKILRIKLKEQYV